MRSPASAGRRSLRSCSDTTKSWRLQNAKHFCQLRTRMADDRTTNRYRKLYARLLRLYPQAYRERFGEAMEQTFGDLCRERTRAGKGLFTFALWVFSETLVGILRESLMHNKSILRIAIVTGCILLIPLVGNLFMGWSWQWYAFPFWGAVLFGTGLTFE